MTAGRGLIHDEIPAEGVTVHSLQLWINLPASDKMTTPRYQDLAGNAVPVRRQPGVDVRFSPALRRGDMDMTARLDQGASIRQDLHADYNAIIVVLEGEIVVLEGERSIGGAEAKCVAAGDVAWLTRGDSAEVSEVAIRAKDDPLRAALCRSSIA